jgi:predicted HicB family RNase H-like nuclease
MAKTERRKDGEAETVKTTIVLERDTWKKLQHKAIDQGKSLQDLVGQALKKYVSRG